MKPMNSKLFVEILPQPDDTTCGPTCLHAVYRYYGLELSLDMLISEVRSLEEGGTLAVYLGLNALERGFRARLYTCDLTVFDPTWFAGKKICLADKLIEQMKVKTDQKFLRASRAYMDFLGRGGKIRYEDLTAGFMRRRLREGTPVLTGLSATCLYNCAREVEEGGRLRYDDIEGRPTGHFVVVTGYDHDSRMAWVADPLRPNPVSRSAEYPVKMNRLINAIMLGIVTYDANLLIIEPVEDDPAREES